MFSDPLPVGDVAPDFSLPDQDGITVSLASLAGKNVVLVFYPADETTICTKQLGEFRDSWSKAQEKNTIVLGVNPAGQERHAKFRTHHKFPFPLLVDKGQKVAESYHAQVVLAHTGKGHVNIALPMLPEYEGAPALVSANHDTNHDHLPGA